MAIQSTGEALEHKNIHSKRELAEHNQVEKTLKKSYDKLKSCVQERDAKSEEINALLKQEIEIRKRTEAALCESEKKYRLLIKSLPGIVFKGSSDGSVDFIDEKIKVLTDYDAVEFNSKKIKWSDIIVKEDVKAAKIFFSQSLKAEKSYVREYRIKSKAGEIHWVKERGQIVCDNRGEIEYINGVFFDITERKLMQKEKDRMKIEIQQAEKIKAIAHDLNNILGVIVGNAELMELFDIPENSPMKSRLERVIEGAYRATDIVQQILVVKNQSRQGRGAGYS
jgi:PAS domain S-box-containing protein